MSQHFYRCIIVSFLTLAPCSAMVSTEPIAQARIIAEITTSDFCRSAFYLQEDQIFINSSSKCSFINPNTKQEIIFLKNNGVPSCIAVHPNGKKIAVSSYHLPQYDQKLTVYTDAPNSSSKKTILSCPFTIKTLQFNPLDDTIAINSSDATDVTIYNYQTNNCYNIAIQKTHSIKNSLYDQQKPIITFHPTKPFLCLAWEKLYIHDLTSATTKIKAHGSLCYHKFCQYSPDGSFIIRGTGTEIILTKPSHKSHKSVAVIQNRENYFDNIAIHPQNNVLLTLSKPDGTLRYWDTNTSKQIIAMNSLSDTNKSLHASSSLSFSPNGTKLLIVLYGKCIIVPVPFEVLYKNITKEKSIATYYVLQEYLYDNKNSLAKDIRHLIMQYLLALSQ